MREKKVIDCKECLIDRDQLTFRSSRPIVDAWELPPPPPTLPGDDDSSPDGMRTYIPISSVLTHPLSLPTVTEPIECSSI
jgi:hypothetical protein